MSLQDQVCAWENIQLAWQNGARGKRGRGATAAFELYLADNLLAIMRELRERTYQPGQYNSFYIHDPKKRLISAAPFRDRVVHHALCNVTVPYFEKHFIYHSYANRVGKGTHRALACATRFARHYKYVLQCDIRQYFPSIDHAILKKVLLDFLPDESIAWLIDRILCSGIGILSEEYNMVYFPGDDLFAVHRPRGLPIGNLTSQLWANCFLDPLDHFIKHTLKCKGYIRFVDDFLLFSNSKATLWEWRAAIIEKLGEARLVLHEDSAVPYPVKAGIPFLGFVLFPKYRLLKRKKGIAYRRRLKHLVATASPEKIQSSLVAWINHASYGDTYGLRAAMLDHVGRLA